MRARLRRSLLCTALLVGATVSATVTAPALHAAAAADEDTTSETTIGYNTERTNWDDAESRLTPASVKATDFGKIFDRTLPGTTTDTPNQIYAQPLVAKGMVIVATEENQVDGLDPSTGKIAWTKSLGTPWTPTNCGDLLPHIGVTSTPVYDAATNAVYVAAKTAAGSTNATYRLHALNPTTGKERAGWPITVGGKSSNSGEVFNPTTANQRPGLLLLNGSVYLGFASHCDHGPYVGYVIGANTSTRKLSIWASESGKATSEGGIWQSGGGLMSDGAGSIYVATGNGLSPGPGVGTAPPGNLAESVVHLRVDGNGNLAAKDFFSPANNARLDQDDRDLGSGGPTALPAAFGTSKYPHLLVQSGKDGLVRLLDRDALGGVAQGAGGTDDVLSSVQLNGLWGRFATFSSGNHHDLFELPSTSPMQMLRVSPNGAGVPTLSSVATTEDSYAYTSGSPVVTSDGTDESSVVIWVVTCDRQTGAHAYLRAYGLPPASGAWKPLASFPLGTVAKFVQPATVNGRVYVGTRDGRVLAFGRPVASAISAASTEFGEVPVGTTTDPQTVTVTANADVTIDAVETAAPFSTPNLSSDITLKKGQTHDFPVTFAPTSTGSVSGNLAVFAKTTGNDDEYDFSLHGTGTQDGLSADPGTLAFGSVNHKESSQLTVNITNTGQGAATLESVSTPGAPFSVVDAPAANTVLPAQSSMSLTVQFSPQGVQDYSDTVTVTADTGSVQVPLTGTGIDGHAHATYDTTSLNFGNVSPGSTKTLSFTITNTGNALMTFSKSGTPVAPFDAPDAIGEGQQVEPGDSVTTEITYTPSSGQVATGSYIVNPGTGQGAQTISMQGNDTPWTGPISSSLGCVTLSRGKLANGTPAVSVPCQGTTPQTLALDPAKHAVHFGSRAGAYCLDVRAAGKANRTPVQFYRCNHSAAQIWNWHANDEMYNPNSGRCLDVQGASNKAYTPLQIYTCNHTAAQYWDQSQVWAARGAISSGVGPTNEFCVDDSGASVTNGSPIVLYRCNRTAAQVITRVGSTLKVQGKCIDVAHALRANRSVLQLYRCNGTAAQGWVRGGDASLRNTGSGKCLDDPGASAANGARLQIYTCNGTDAQRWTFPA